MVQRVGLGVWSWSVSWPDLLVWPWSIGLCGGRGGCDQDAVAWRELSLMARARSMVARLQLVGGLLSVTIFGGSLRSLRVAGGCCGRLRLVHVGCGHFVGRVFLRVGGDCFQSVAIVLCRVFVFGRRLLSSCACAGCRSLFPQRIGAALPTSSNGVLQPGFGEGPQSASSVRTAHRPVPCGSSHAPSSVN